MSDAAPSVLLGDDEQLMRRVLRALLSSRGYITYEASSGEEILQAASGLQPDVILLDLGLPDIDGIEVIRRLRQFAQTAIIILSVRAAASDKIAALDAGADDYLTKPYQPADLCEHVRAAILRNHSTDEAVWVGGDLSVDLQRQAVQVDNKTIQLTVNEYDLLRVLVLNAGRLLTQRRLAREVWSEKDDDEALQLLRTTIGGLRVKLETDPARPQHIVTEPGVGYRLRVAT
ncbi:MAG TPA: response regulator [Terriglobales bacterium]|nr:response regulator [Terriglobales bacterium]